MFPNLLGHLVHVKVCNVLLLSENDLLGYCFELVSSSSRIFVRLKLRMKFVMYQLLRLEAQRC